MIIHYFKGLPENRDYGHGIESVSNACCDRMLRALGVDFDFCGQVYVDEKGEIRFDNSGDEYGTTFDDVHYCPFCSDKIDTVPV